MQKSNPLRRGLPRPLPEPAQLRAGPLRLRHALCMEDTPRRQGHYNYSDPRHGQENTLSRVGVDGTGDARSPEGLAPLPTAGKLSGMRRQMKLIGLILAHAEKSSRVLQGGADADREALAAVSAAVRHPAMGAFSWTFSEAQCGQRMPAGQRCRMNQASAAASSGNISWSWMRVIPRRKELPGQPSIMSVRLTNYQTNVQLGGIIFGRLFCAFRFRVTWSHADWSS